MSDDLVKRLRSPRNIFYEYAVDDGAFLREAADRIEELEAKLAQQDDLVQAAVAAALTRAAEDVRQWGSLYSGSEDVTDEVANDILALITEDAQAALDRVVAARFGVVRSEVVRLSAEGKIDSEATERLLAAIRKGGE